MSTEKTSLPGLDNLNHLGDDSGMDLTPPADEILSESSSRDSSGGSSLPAPSSSSHDVLSYTEEELYATLSAQEAGLARTARTTAKNKRNLSMLANKALSLSTRVDRLEREAIRGYEPDLHNFLINTIHHSILAPTGAVSCRSVLGFERA